MKDTAQAKVMSLRIDFDKLATMVNLKYSPRFLEAVKAIQPIPIEILNLKTSVFVHVVLQSN
jgi:hypothetical protein